MRKPMGAGQVTLTLLADTARFVWRVFRSPRVPLRVKLLFAGLGVYLVTPVDVIPDSIPVLGAMDDAVIAAAALSLGAKWIPREVLSELWQSDLPFEEAVAALKAAVQSLRGKPRRPRPGASV